MLTKKKEILEIEIKKNKKEKKQDGISERWQDKYSKMEN